VSIAAPCSPDGVYKTCEHSSGSQRSLGNIPPFREISIVSRDGIQIANFILPVDFWGFSQEP
jgi:hypothetical protein